MEPGQSDTGLECLTLLLRFRQVAIEPAQIVHQFTGSTISVSEMLPCARQLKLKARAVSQDWRGLAKLPLPAIAECREGRFVIIGRLSEEGFPVRDQLVDRPQVIKRADFEADVPTVSSFETILSGLRKPKGPFGEGL